MAQRDARRRSRPGGSRSRPGASRASSTPRPRRRSRAAGVRARLVSAHDGRHDPEGLAERRRAWLGRTRLYLVCEARPGGRDPEELLRPALQGGVDIVQLREKSADERDDRAGGPRVPPALRRLRRALHRQRPARAGDRLRAPTACTSDRTTRTRGEVRRLIGARRADRPLDPLARAGRRRRRGRLHRGRARCTRRRPSRTTRPSGIDLVRYAAEHARGPVLRDRRHRRRRTSTTVRGRRRAARRGRARDPRRRRSRRGGARRCARGSRSGSPRARAAERHRVSGQTEPQAPPPRAAGPVPPPAPAADGRGQRQARPRTTSRASSWCRCARASAHGGHRRRDRRRADRDVEPDRVRPSASRSRATSSTLGEVLPPAVLMMRDGGRHVVRALLGRARLPDAARVPDPDRRRLAR